MTVKDGLRWLLTVTMIWIGVKHFTGPDFFVSIMPDYLPWHLELVYLSGVFEILGGLGLAYAPTRRFSAFGLIALYVAVFPANIHMAVNDIPLASGEHLHPAMLWGRLFFQPVFIAWAYWFTLPDVAAEEGPGSAVGSKL